MKYLILTALVLWPWGVKGQYELPCTSSVVLPYIHGGPDSVLMDRPMPYIRRNGDTVLITGHPPTNPCITRADVQRMIDSALTKHREIRVDTINWKRYDRDKNGNEQTWFGTRYDTTWIFVRPEEKL